MKIAYVCHWNPFVEDGVTRKIRSQERTWSAGGADVRIFCLSAATSQYEKSISLLPGRTFLYRDPYIGRASSTMRMFRAVSLWQPDVIYLRYTPLVPPPRRLLKCVPTVVEINGDDRFEYRLQPRSKQLLNSISRRIVLTEARGFASVTPELAAGVPPDNGDARSISITNGIDLNAAAPLPPASEARPRVVFLGVSAPWAGVDKILRLSASLPEFDFDLVGVGRALGTSLPSNVRVYGFCGREEYEPVLAAADVALGPVALHRKSMSQAAPLKVREYLLRGIPVMFGYDDPDLDDNPWFALRLPNTERNLEQSVDAIRDFVYSVAGTRVPREEVAHRIDIVIKRKSAPFVPQIVR